jgi:hypothetical protein
MFDPSILVTHVKKAHIGWGDPETTLPDGTLVEDLALVKTEYTGEPA